MGRDDEDASGYPDVDVALTTRELARMIKRARINFTKLPDEQFDSPLGESTAPALYSALPAALWRRLSELPTTG